MMLGPARSSGDIVPHVRGAGCGGTQEVMGRGALANGKGAICMNGNFSVDLDPAKPGLIKGAV